jgi:hypothetical protein
MSSFEAVMGTTPGVTLGITLIFMGACAFLTGQALAATWRPIWHVFPYALLLGCGDRFLVYALFDGRLFLLSGYLIDSIWLLAMLLFAFRVTRVRQMSTQYPWLYERVGLMGWRER